MPCRVLNLSAATGWDEALHLLESRNRPDPELESSVKAIIDRVATEGDAALLDYTRRFD